MTLKEACGDMRGLCKRLEQRTRMLKQDPVFDGDQAYPSQHGEMKAHIMLAVRHFEDARMRLGKVLQYADDGVSIYDK